MRTPGLPLHITEIPKQSRPAMTTLVFELFEALKRAGVDEETARKAAQAVMGIENKESLATKADVSALKTDLAALEGRIQARFARLEIDIAWIKWIITGGVGLYVLRSVMEWLR